MSSGESWDLGFDDFLMQRFRFLGEMQGGSPIRGITKSVIKCEVGGYCQESQRSSSQKRENLRIRRWGILESRSRGLISQSQKCRSATETYFKEKKYEYPSSDDPSVRTEE